MKKRVENPYDHIISIRFQKDHVAKLKQLKEQGVSASFVIRKALEQHFTALKNGGYLSDGR